MTSTPLSFTSSPAILAKRVNTIPEDFLDHLNKSFAGFKEENDRHKFALARMAWLGITKCNQHSHFPDAMTYSYIQLELAFGRFKFNEVNLRLNFFIRTPNWSKDKCYTRGYTFSSRAQAVIKDYLDRPKSAVLTRLVMADGKALRTVPASIASKDKSGVTTKAWTSAKALSLVGVNLEALERLKRELTVTSETFRAEQAAIGRFVIPELAAIERTIETIGKVQVLSRIELSGVGVMAHRYEEAQSGRLYPLGTSLASAQSIVKDAALEGHWEYDISNCHFAITLQLASLHGYKCVEIENYLENKKVVREGIAIVVGALEDQVKTCLLALLYGARATTWHELLISIQI